MAQTKKKTKTETSKERLVYVYLPSHKMINQWKQKAKQAKMSLSKFVIEHVNNSLQQEENQHEYYTRIELQQQNKKLLEENQKLQKKNSQLNTLVERLEEELRTYRIQPFINPTFQGKRTYEPQLITLLKQYREIRKEDILKKLNINPMDIDTVKAIKNQLEHLEQYGLIKDKGGKWQWQT